MAHAPRKIVFSVPSLVPERAQRAPEQTPRHPAPGPPAPPAEGGDVRKLATIMEVGEALAGTLNLQAGLYGALEVLERRCGALRGSIALLEEESGLLAVEASLAEPRPGRVRYRVGEGPIGRAAESGAPVVVPRTGRESGQDVALLCVPILLDGTAAGTLQIELRHETERDLERMVKVLRIAAGMISQSLRIQRLIGQERDTAAEGPAAALQHFEDAVEPRLEVERARQCLADLHDGRELANVPLGTLSRRHGPEPGVGYTGGGAVGDQRRDVEDDLAGWMCHAQV